MMLLAASEGYGSTAVSGLVGSSSQRGGRHFGRFFNHNPLGGSVSGLEIGWSSIGVSKKAVLVVVSPLTDPPSVGKPNDCSFHHGLSKADLYVDKPEEANGQYCLCFDTY